VKLVINVLPLIHCTPTTQRISWRW